jgi:hypothetical protein
VNAQIVSCMACQTRFDTVADSINHPCMTSDPTSTDQLIAANAAKFAQMIWLEEQIQARKVTLGFANETRMPDYLWAQHVDAFTRQKADLFELVDSLTADEAAAFAAYRKIARYAA